MALNATSWSTAIVFAMDAAGYFNGLSAGEKTSIEDAWKVVCQGHVNHITNNAVVTTTGSTSTGSPGGPLPIIAQLGTIT